MVHHVTRKRFTLLGEGREERAGRGRDICRYVNVMVPLPLALLATSPGEVTVMTHELLLRIFVAVPLSLK